MPVSPKQSKSVQKYVKNHYDKIVLTMPKGYRDAIKEAASAAGQSVNGFIMEAVRDRVNS